MAATSQKRQAMEALVERYAASQEDAEMDVVETFPAAAATDDKRARTVAPRKGPTCAFCAHPGATRRCGRCKAVNYCSPGCQREHWRAHKDTCAPHATFVPSAGKSLELQIAALYGEVDRCLEGAGLPAVAPAWTAGQEKRAKFPTSKAPISAVFHSFRLIFGRAIISRNGLEAWMLFPERARAEHSC